MACADFQIEFAQPGWRSPSTAMHSGWPTGCTEQPQSGQHAVRALRCPLRTFFLHVPSDADYPFTYNGVTYTHGCVGNSYGGFGCERPRCLPLRAVLTKLACASNSNQGARRPRASRSVRATGRAASRSACSGWSTDRPAGQRRAAQRATSPSPVSISLPNIVALSCGLSLMRVGETDSGLQFDACVGYGYLVTHFATDVL